MLELFHRRLTSSQPASYFLAGICLVGDFDNNMVDSDNDAAVVTFLGPSMCFPSCS
jgi:hypothetical protein